MRIPALLNVLMTDGISSRGGSTIPTIPTKVSPVLACCATSSSKWLEAGRDLSCSFEMVLRASRITRLPCADHVFLISSMMFRVTSSRTFVSPSLLVYFVQRPMRTSGAPLIKRRLLNCQQSPLRVSWQTYVSSSRNVAVSGSDKARPSPSICSSWNVLIMYLFLLLKASSNVFFHIWRSSETGPRVSENRKTA